MKTLCKNCGHGWLQHYQTESNNSPRCSMDGCCCTGFVKDARQFDLPIGPIEHTNDFQRSLQRSLKASDLPIWEQIYRQCFPAMQAMHKHPQNGDHQKAGIDRTVVLANGKVISIDEKAREKNRITRRVYDDIAIEEWSDIDRKKLGWGTKELLCDYIAYAILPLGIGYLLPVPQLQAAWAKYGDLWKSKGYPRIEAKNNGWKTISWGIPVKVLFGAMGSMLRAGFEPKHDF